MVLLALPAGDSEKVLVGSVSVSRVGLEKSRSTPFLFKKFVKKDGMVVSHNICVRTTIPSRPITGPAPLPAESI